VVLVVAAMPALGSGYVFKKLEVEKILYNPVAVAAALAVGGVAMIVIEHYFWRRKRGSERTSDVCGVRLWQALVIGFVQCVALWPGTSRSMITILAALVIGLDMLAAAEFSFLLALPTLGAATAFTLYKHGQQLVEHVGPLAMVVGLVGPVTAGLPVEMMTLEPVSGVKSTPAMLDSCKRPLV
jgi:undecaprenyl-diphosphatase